MLVKSSTPPPRILPAEPPDTWCPVAEDGKHNWIYARALGTPTRPAAHWHKCTLCKELDEQPTEALARAWPPRCKRCGSPKFRPDCEVCFDVDISAYPVEPDDIEDAPTPHTHLEST